MQTTPPTEPRVPPVDGRPVIGVDRYEAGVLRRAVNFKVLSREDDGMKTWSETTDRETALLLVGTPATLVYAVAADGRSCCVTARTVKVHDAIYGGESP